MKTVIKQKWEESERGWGVRPDGYSLHLSESDRIDYIKEYWADMPSGEAPDEYSRPSGSPELIDVDESVFVNIQQSKNGIRKW